MESNDFGVDDGGRLINDGVASSQRRTIKIGNRRRESIKMKRVFRPVFTIRLVFGGYLVSFKRVFDSRSV